MRSGKKRILYADSDEENLKIVNLALMAAGYEVTVVCSIKAALHSWQAALPDLCIIANRLSDGPGLELCHQFRLVDQQTPIIFFTTFPSRAEHNEVLAARAQAYLAKPDPQFQLKPTIERLLCKR